MQNKGKIHVSFAVEGTDVHEIGSNLENWLSSFKNSNVTSLHIGYYKDCEEDKKQVRETSTEPAKKS